MKSYGNILIVCFGSASDVIIATPLVRVLKTHYPECNLHFLADQHLRGMLEANPYLSSVPGPSLPTLKELKPELVIDLHWNWKSWNISRQLSAPTKKASRQLFSRWLHVHLKINQLPNQHQVSRYFAAVHHMNLKPDLLGLDYFIPESDEVEPEWLPRVFRKNYAVFGIGASRKTKRLPMNKMIELCAKINMPIILVGDAEDTQRGEELQAFFENSSDVAVEDGLSKMNKKTTIYNAAGRFNINQNAFLVKNADYVFTHDNYVMQMAAAFKKQIFTIWGSSSPAFGRYPYRSKFWVFENKTLSCRPCSVTGLKKCPKRHFQCMNALTFDFYLE